MHFSQLYVVMVFDLHNIKYDFAPNDYSVNGILSESAETTWKQRSC